MYCAKLYIIKYIQYIQFERGDGLYIALSNSEATPLYEQIKQQVVEQIVNGKLSPGWMLPSIRALAKELEISVITVKKAYEELEAANYIITVPGKGSFVAEAGAEFVREAKLKQIEEYFEIGISESLKLGMSEDEILKNFLLILKETR